MLESISYFIDGFTLCDITLLSSHRKYYMSTLLTNRQNGYDILYYCRYYMQTNVYICDPKCKGYPSAISCIIQENQTLH